MTNKPVIAVSGFKKSGKTTLIVRLLPLLAEKGIKAAVIKRDAHSFTPDTPGTDSFRYFQAGACGSAVYDNEKFSLSYRAPVTEQELIEAFPDVDLIILEGFKRSAYPKLEIIRSDMPENPVIDSDTCIAVISDIKPDIDIPFFHLNAVEDIAEFIASYIKKGASDDR